MRRLFRKLLRLFKRPKPRRRIEYRCALPGAKDPALPVEVRPFIQCITVYEWDPDLLAKGRTFISKRGPEIIAKDEHTAKALFSYMNYPVVDYLVKCGEVSAADIADTPLLRKTHFYPELN